MRKIINSFRGSGNGGGSGRSSFGAISSSSTASTSILESGGDSPTAHASPVADGESRHGQFLKSAVYGALDGIITTFCVVLADAGSHTDPFIVLVLGVANLIADGLSMGFGDYLSTKSQQENYAMERARETWETEYNIEGERQEMIEFYTQKGLSLIDATEVVRVMSRYKEAFVDTMMAEELGLMPDFKDAFMNGFVTFLSFLVFGSVPILPYVFAHVTDSHDGGAVLGSSIAATALILVVLGYCKARFTGSSVIRSALETLFVGAVASGSAYLIGVLMEPSIQQDGAAGDAR